MTDAYAAISSTALDGKRTAAEELRFDRWLSRRLHEAHDGVLRETVPDDLLRLARLFGRIEDPAPLQKREQDPNQHNSG